MGRFHKVIRKDGKLEWWFEDDIAQKSYDKQTDMYVFTMKNGKVITIKRDEVRNKQEVDIWIERSRVECIQTSKY